MGGKEEMRPYHRPIPNTWWLERRPYFLFMMRELTAVFVGGYCAFLLFFIYKLSQGLEAYEGIIQALESPLSIVLHIIVLLFALYHSITWFNLTPKILVLRIGEEKVPPILIVGANFVAWLGLSILLAWVIIGLKL